MFLHRKRPALELHIQPSREQAVQPFALDAHVRGAPSSLRRRQLCKGGADRFVEPPASLLRRQRAQFRLRSGYAPKVFESPMHEIAAFACIEAKLARLNS